jgi:hypothetical protein
MPYHVDGRHAHHRGGRATRCRPRLTGGMGVAIANIIRPKGMNYIVRQAREPRLAAAGDPGGVTTDGAEIMTYHNP